MSTTPCHHRVEPLQHLPRLYQLASGLFDARGGAAPAAQAPSQSPSRLSAAPG